MDGSDFLTLTLTRPFLLLFLFVGAVFSLFTYRSVRQRVNDYVSHLIHYYLVWRYPIRSVVDGRPLPTCPYRWPNGQGDVGKFLEGEKNSGRWGKAYGGVYRLWSGMSPEVVISDPADVKAVFQDSDKHAKATNNDAGWLMGELLGQCLGLISGTEYHSVRAEVTPPFVHAAATTYQSLIARTTTEHLDRLAADDVDNADSKLRHGRIDPVRCLAPLPFRIMADILYGEDMAVPLRAELQSLAALRESLWARMLQGGVTARFGWTRYFPTRTARDLREFKRRWAAFNDRAYEAAVQVQADGNGSTIVPWYAAVREGRMTREQLLQTIDEMLFANLDVTMGGLSWNLLFLATNPEVQEQLWREVTDAASTGPDHSWESYIASSSTLLAASIIESSRLKPLAAFSVPQAAPTDRVIGEGRFLVPAGTNFIVDTHALNIRGAHWGPDGGVYRPQRFLGSDPDKDKDRDKDKDKGAKGGEGGANGNGAKGTGAPPRASELRYRLWRFGFGPRRCLGRFVVDLVLREAVAQLVLRYRLAPAESTTWDKDPASWILHPNTELSCERRRPPSG